MRNPAPGLFDPGVANLRFGHPDADELVDLPQRLRLLSHPGDDAGRTDQRRAEQIAERLGGAILRQKLLDIEIDRRRPEALAILGQRGHAIGERRSRLAAATGAAVDRGLMFGDHERSLGKVEHLALLDPDRRPRIERRTAMAAGARPMCSITQSGSATCRNVSPLWPFCPPLALSERPRRLPATRGFFFNPSLEGGLELLELSCPNCRRRSATSA